MAIIEVKDLVKVYKTSVKDKGISGYLKHLIKPKYKEHIAVNHINFNVEKGEIVGYIGENGAGKSTTIKMLTGLLTPTSGSIIVNDIVPNENRIKNNKQIGAVFGQKTQLWWDLPVIESFKLIKRLYRISDLEYKENLERFSELLDLEDLLNIQVRNLSLGQKMRCEIAATFLHNPQIVYLDEPTIGLDILVKEKIRQFIKDINQEKKITIILTTHDLKDIEEVCKRIILIDRGEVVYDGDKEIFKERYGKNVILEFSIKNKKNIITSETVDEEFEVFEETNNCIKLKFNRSNNTVINIINIISKYCAIVDIHINEEGLEEILKEIYRGNMIC